MRIFLTGATGFLGRALLLALRREGHSVVAWVRSLPRARARIGDQAELLAIEEGEEALRSALAGCDAVVHLAGEPILSRWTEARKRALRESRVRLTERLVAALETVPKRPRVFVSGSAVGFYGDRGEHPLDESRPAGEGFLAHLCRDWEAAARRAEAFGVRVVLLRTGVVLGLDGGALPNMVPAFRLGLGGRLGSGRQYMPWIHVEDWVRSVLFALANERVRGPVHATAPAPVTNREFTRVLARALRRPALLPVPAFALELVLGGVASVLLESQRALPVRLAELGFEHRHPTLEGALRDLLVEHRVRIERLSKTDELPPSSYLARRRPRYALSGSSLLPVPLEEAFAFFSAPENLGFLTPGGLGLEIRARSAAPGRDSTVDYRLRIGPIGFSWRTRFESWSPPEHFVDVQERGPYRCWWHEHRFEGVGDSTGMRDRVLYAPPLGVLGRLAQRLLIADQLGDIFAQRALALRLRFGDARPVVTAPALGERARAS